MVVQFDDHGISTANGSVSDVMTSDYTVGLWVGLAMWSTSPHDSAGFAFHIAILCPWFTKVWVRQEDRSDSGGDRDEIPFNDIKNIVAELDLKNEQTKARCRAWLCLPPTKKLKVDIIFPAFDFDCRITLRKSEWDMFTLVEVQWVFHICATSIRSIEVTTTTITTTTTTATTTKNNN